MSNSTFSNNVQSREKFTTLAVGGSEARERLVDSQITELNRNINNLECICGELIGRLERVSDQSTRPEIGNDKASPTPSVKMAPELDAINGRIEHVVDRLNEQIRILEI